MLQQVAIALSVHKETRSKKIINVLHDFGVSIEYNRLLRIESQIADVKLSRLRTNDNIFIPADFFRGRHVCFAIDNVDFAEDIADGKRMLRGPAMAIYQRSLI